MLTSGFLLTMHYCNKIQQQEKNWKYIHVDAIKQYGAGNVKLLQLH